jgi:hypothetical protein
LRRSSALEIMKSSSDGTLLRMEGIYCKDSGWLRDSNGGRGVIVTRGLGRMISEAHQRVMEKLKKDPGYLDSLREKLRNALFDFTAFLCIYDPFNTSKASLSSA